MLTYPWKCTVLHCNHLGNTWKPLVLMTRHFDYCPSASIYMQKWNYVIRQFHKTPTWISNFQMTGVHSIPVRSHWWPCGWSRCLSDMKCTIMIWRSWVRTPVGLNMGSIVLQSIHTWITNIYLMTWFDLDLTLMILTWPNLTWPDLTSQSVLSVQAVNQFCLSICLSSFDWLVWLSIHWSICLSVRPFVCLSFGGSACPSIWHSIHPPNCLIFIEIYYLKSLMTAVQLYH